MATDLYVTMLLHAEDTFHVFAVSKLHDDVYVKFTIHVQNDVLVLVI